jgi:antitoxin (DNA-binding transcriptional repressor) of toxin-antitoxin stability system
MKSIELKEATQSLGQYIQALGKEPLLITIKKTPVAVLTPLADLDGLQLKSNIDALRLLKKSVKEQLSSCLAPLSTYIQTLGRESTIVGFEGKPIAMLVAITDIETVSLSHNPKFLSIIDRSKKQQKLGQLTRSEEVKKKLGLV